MYAFMAQYVCVCVWALSVAAVVEEAKYPCADYKPGDDDLQSFDFIRKFELGTAGIMVVKDVY